MQNIAGLSKLPALPFRKKTTYIEPMKKILVYPDEILRTEAKPVENIDGELQKLIDDMAETMYKAKGVGLAANQVGVLKRLFVMDISQGENGERGELVVLINPRIIGTEGQDVMEEGCLSVPGFSAKLKRPAVVCVKALDREGNEIELEGKGLFARCVLHELDHLDGICFVDRLSPIKKAMFRKRWQKIKAEQEAKV